MIKHKKLESAAITIFGAKGDLTSRKLIPAFYNLYADGHLPPAFAIFCVDFIAVDEQAYRDDLLTADNEFSRSGKADKDKWAAFSANIFYIQGDFQQDKTYTTLKDKIKGFNTG